MYTRPLPLQTKQNTRSFKMSAFNSLQLFPLRASPSVRGKHVACPQGVGRGARGVRAGDARPSPLTQLAASGGLGLCRDRDSYLVRHLVWFLWLGERLCCVALGFGAVTFAPPQVTALASSWRGRRLPQLHLVPAQALSCSHSLLRQLSDASSGRLCSDILKRIGGSACRKPPAAILVKDDDASPASRPPSWQRFSIAGSRSSPSWILKGRRYPHVLSDVKGKN